MFPLSYEFFSVWIWAKYQNSLIANKYDKPISGQCSYFILSKNTKKVPGIIKLEHWPEVGYCVKAITFKWHKHQPEVFCRNGVLKNFAKFPVFLLNKIAVLANFIKKETLAQEFSCEICEIFKNNFFTEYLWTTTFEMRSYSRKSIFSCNFSTFAKSVIRTKKFFKN